MTDDVLCAQHVHVHVYDVMVMHSADEGEGVREIAEKLRHLVSSIHPRLSESQRDDDEDDDDDEAADGDDNDQRR